MIGIYVRVSTEEQVKKGFSLQDQIRACQLKAGANETHIYMDEGQSGEFLDRPALTRLRKDIQRKKIRQVVCLDPDRLSRKLMNQLILADEFEKQGVTWTFVNGDYAKTPEGNLFYSMRGAISEFEKAKITERMKRGRLAKARQGKVLRDFRIFGYDYDKEQAQLVINHAEAQVVKLIFERFLRPRTRNEGINGIAKYLTEKAIPTKRGASVWHRQVVRQILMNRTYIGEFYQNRWNSEGMMGNAYRDTDEKVSITKRPQSEWQLLSCPAIIDQNTFEQVQSLLATSRRRFAQKSKHFYLLSGLLRCMHCGNTLTGRKNKHWGKVVYVYSDRKNTAGASRKGCGMHIKCEELDQMVWNQLKEWLKNPCDLTFSDRLFQKLNRCSEDQVEYDQINHELQKIKKGKKRMLLLYAKNSQLADENFREIYTKLTSKEKQLSKQLTKMKMEVKPYQNVQLQKLLMKYFDENKIDLLSDIDKRELIRKVICEIMVSKEKITLHLF
ncbi:recombinase family protein [Hazenella sp. IB182357]|uniref:Recombinase family protein n=1 Tax=Polycladospora coralii TaxID=2771432 RepID=A0A926RT14_9BACL|nr:recombinase family protein [Polycladospora coralii]MBD1371098.1 recombinase family protein [Polycladospora coralii]MBS7530040.1 recombinase family protein [Polycladospora coralii]